MLSFLRARSYGRRLPLQRTLLTHRHASHIAYALQQADSSGPELYAIDPTAQTTMKQKTNFSLKVVAVKSRRKQTGAKLKRAETKRKQSPKLHTLPGPYHNETHIRESYMTQCSTPPPAKILEDPVNHISNLYNTYTGRGVPWETEKFYVNHKLCCRVTATLDFDGTVIEATGDAGNIKEAKHNACQSAVYQLHIQGLLTKKPNKTSKQMQSQSPTVPAMVTMKDGTEANLDYGKEFIDYYCRKFNFPKPEIRISQTSGRKWEAIISVSDKDLGLGVADGKKDAQTLCYFDAIQYLESCDPELWGSYVEAAKRGSHLGMASKVFFQMSWGLKDDVNYLREDMQNSLLARNRPKSSSFLELSNLQSFNQRQTTPPDQLMQKSKHLSARRQAYLNDTNLERMRETRAALPVFTKAKELLDHINNHDVTICMAATGSGKTTQIPQIIFDEWIDQGRGADCNILCTQPRRLAAVSVADRVSKERGEVLGKGTVGYHVRFDAKLPEDNGSVTFCTTGVFLKRLQNVLGDEKTHLDHITHVVVDEVHERDISTDLLLMVLKRVMKDRKARGKPLKVILMSATIDPTLFQTYFMDDAGKPASVIDIPGRSFPVVKHFLDDFHGSLQKEHGAAAVFRDESVSRYLANEIDASTPLRNDLLMPYPLIGLTIAHVLRKTDSGHVLVFLPGFEEIMRVKRLLTEANTFNINFNDPSKFSLHILHSSVPLSEQQSIFESPAPGVRRIILATNIAETSVTIPDVVYVVDTGRSKEMQFDPLRHLSSLVSAWVGSSNLNQRAGRAGRHRPGEYFGLLGKKRLETLNAYQTVEMKRVDLSDVVMHVKALDLPKLKVQEVLASTIEPPNADRVVAAMVNLRMIGALDEQSKLTALGHILLALGIDAHLGRLILYGCFFRCLDQALTLAALLSNRDPFLAPLHLKDEAKQVKSEWAPQAFKSDALGALQAFNAWWALQGAGKYSAANQFCHDNFLSKPTLMAMVDLKNALLANLYRVGAIEISAGGNVIRPQVTHGGRQNLKVPPELNANGDSLPLLAAMLTIASHSRFAIRTGPNTLRTMQDKVALVHPSSVNSPTRNDRKGADFERSLYAYAEKKQNTTANSSPTTFLCTTTQIDPMIYILFGANDVQMGDGMLNCDDWLPVVGNMDALQVIQKLRTIMDDAMLRVYEGLVLKQRSFRREKDAHQSGRLHPSPLSESEVVEIDVFTREIVRVLNRYSEERRQFISRLDRSSPVPFKSTDTHRGLSRR